jgi:hypothetical protein
MKKIALALAVLVSVSALFVPPVLAANPPLSNSVDINNFSVSYPDGWSTIRSGRVTVIVGVPADQQATLGGKFVFTPQVSVSTEQRLDHADALAQLDDIVAGAGPTLTKLTVGGWPAIQWRNTVPWPHARGQAPAPGSALAINTVIAAGNQLIRLYGSLPSDAPSDIADTISAIETSVTFSPRSSGSADNDVSALVRSAVGGWRNG